METFSALLAICAGNSPVPGEFPTQRPVTRSFDVYFDLRLNKRLSKQSWGWWFETQSRPLWRHRNVSRNMDIVWVRKQPGNQLSEIKRMSGLEKIVLNATKYEVNPIWSLPGKVQKLLNQLEARNGQEFKIAQSIPLRSTSSTTKYIYIYIRKSL